MKQEIYLDKNEKILKMLENGGNLDQTDEEKTEFSYKNERVIVSTPYLKKLIPDPNNYGERTILSLTGAGIGLSLKNSSKGDSSYKTFMKDGEFSIKLKKPRATEITEKPKRLDYIA